MHILFVTDNFVPEVNAPATRTYEHCKEWVKEGVEVTVITCAPNFPRGKVFDGYKNKFYQEEVIDGIRVIRVWSYIAANKGFVRRLIDFNSFAIMSFLIGLFIKKVDVVIGTSPQFFTTVSAYGLSVIKNKPWIFELRDLWPESIKAVSSAKVGKILYLFEKLELFLYRKANLIIPVTDSFKRDLVHRGIDPEKIKIVKNGANLDLYKPLEKDQSVIDELGINDKFVIGYIGTHGLAHKLDIFLDYASNGVASNIEFVFIGAGAEKEKLVRKAKSMSLKNVKFFDPIQKKDIPKYLSVMDAALVPLKKSDTFKTVIPSKIFETSSMRIPILLGVEGESQEIIEKYEAGLTFEPENLIDFDEKLNILMNDKEQYLKCQEGGTILAKDFDRKKMASKMLKYVKELV